MKQLTRQEVEAVVENIKNPNPRLYCPNCHNDTIKCTDCDCILWKNDHTYIGTALEKIREKEGYVFTHKIYSDLLIYWQPLGLSHSLQQIIEASGWERVRLYPLLLSTTFEGEPVTKAPSIATQDVEVLKSPEANALFIFLKEIV